MATKKFVCICQICNCGRHYCSHRPQQRTNEAGPCVITEYKDTYKNFANHEPIRPLKPETSHRPSTQPFNGSTTYKEIFVTHGTLPISKRLQAKYQRPDGVFDGTSSYMQDYFAKKSARTKSAKPSYNKAPLEALDSVTVNQETYKSWDLSLPAQFKAPKPAMAIAKGTFDHKTTFQEDYHGHIGQTGRETIQPPNPSLSVGSGKIADETTTRADYTKKEARPEKSAKPAYNKIEHNQPFDHKTTTKNAYSWPDGKPADSCKPKGSTKLASEAIEADTTHNLTYKPWKVPKTPCIRPGGGWTEPADTFDHKTTVQHDYDAKRGAPAKSARPNYVRPKPGDFDAMTTHGAAFQAWDSSPRQSFQPAARYTGPKSLFNGKTTFQSDFKGPVDFKTRPGLCIPKEGGFAFNGSQEFKSMYKSTFLGDRPPTCPARSLTVKGGKSKVGYLYELDHNGHQFYKVPQTTRIGIDMPQATKMAIEIV